MKDKRQEKINKHFTVICNGHKVKVLKCKKIDTNALEIITKTDNSNFWSDDTIIIEIDEKEQQHIFKLKCKTKYSAGYIFRYNYEILSEQYIDI